MSGANGGCARHTCTQTPEKLHLQKAASEDLHSPSAVAVTTVSCNMSQQENESGLRRLRRERKEEEWERRRSGGARGKLLIRLEARREKMEGKEDGRRRGRDEPARGRTGG